MYPEEMAPGLALCSRYGLTLEAERKGVAETFQSLGYRVRELRDELWDPQREKFLLVLGNLHWFPKLKRQLLDSGRPEGTRFALWHSEPLPPPKSTGLRWPLPTMRDAAKILLRDRRASDIYTNYFLLRALNRRRLPDVLAVSTRGRVDFLKEKSIPSRHLPLGYEPVCGRDLGIHRDIEVLFLGDLRIRRRKTMLERLRRLGVQVTSVGGWADPELWGEARTKLLNRTRVFINIQRFPSEFSGLRFIFGMANGALVLSEPVYDCYPFVEGRHFISAPVEDMPAVIQRYLRDESARRAITDEAYRFVTNELTTVKSVTTLASWMNE